MHYQFSYTHPNTHLLSITLTIEKVKSGEICLYLPSWRPGRYQIANFAKNILGIEVFNGQGTALDFEKAAKDTWIVYTKGTNIIKVCYQYYAFQMDAGNSWLDDEQLYLNFINCALYVRENLNKPCRVSLDIPDNYQVATGLPSTGKFQFEASSYYQLVDSPLMASASLRKISYQVKGYGFHLWIHGDLPKTDEEIIRDFSTFTEKQIAVMGSFPCEEYHFLYQCLPYKHYHGVEHFNSTMITIGPSEKLKDRALYKEFLGVSSHELFHTWNVIRLRPQEMSPYDFQHENYHQTGFITEGITTYYGDLFLARSGVFSVEEYLQELNKLLKKHYENEGRKNMSIANASFDLWLDGYEKGVPGRKVSIYNEGALAALMLDLKARLATSHQQSLDTIMKAMWDRFGENQKGYSYEDYQEVAEEVSGLDLKGYFESYVSGVMAYEKELATLFGHFGLGFELKYPKKTEEKQFGFRLEDNRVVQIAPDSPAEQMLSLKDQLMEVNGKTFDGSLPDTPRHLHLKVNRFERVLEIELFPKEGAGFFAIYQLSLKPQLSIPEKKNLAKWLEKAISHL